MKTEKYIAVIITSIEAEDGGGQSGFNLTFSTNKECISESFFVKIPEKIEPGVFLKNLVLRTSKVLLRKTTFLDFTKKKSLGLRLTTQQKLVKE